MLLRLRDQAVIAAVTFALLVALVAYVSVAHRQSISYDRGVREGRTVRYEIEVNTAPWPEFAQVEGVGEVLARRIVAAREKRGGFRSLEDIQAVPGVGDKLFSRIARHSKPIELTE